MNLINELRMLAEDLYSAWGYSRYAAALSKAADEIEELQRYHTAYNEWIDKTEWLQKSLPAKYLGMHRADALKDMISELLDRLEAAESDALEQARLNGMGSEREAALMAKLEAAEKDIAIKEEVIDSLATVIKRLDAQCDAAEGERDECTRRRLEAADHFAAQTELMKKKCGELRAKITEMEKQEPARLVTAVAYRWRYRGAVMWQYGELTEETARLAKEHNHEVQPLYALPGAKGEEK